MRILSAALSQPSHGAAAALAPSCGLQLFPSAASFSSPRSLAIKSVLPSTRRESDCILGNGRGLEPVHSFFPTSPAIVSSVDGLFEFMCAGPLIKKIGFY